MKSIIFKTAANFLLFITLIFSIWVLFRGHNSPGGGFVGGLIAASGFALYLLSHGVKALQRIIKINLILLLTLGFIFILGSGLMSSFSDEPFLTAIWFNLKSIHLKVGTPILFDVGVYLVVLSSVLIMMIALEESI